MTIIHTLSARGKLKFPLLSPSDATGSSLYQWIFQGKFADLTEYGESERNEIFPLLKILTRDHFSVFYADAVIKDNSFRSFFVY